MLKTNLTSLKKLRLDKLKIKNTDKLKTVHDDLAKLSNVVKNYAVKKTEYNALKTKVDEIHVSNYVLQTKFENDVKNIDIKINSVCSKTPDITSEFSNKIEYYITALFPTSTFNSKVTELENKWDNKIPNITGLATKTELTAVENKIPDVVGYVKKTDYANEITSIKNDYATNASLDSKINDLKAQHIKDEVKKVDDKVTKNSSDILGFENRLKQKEDIIDEVQRVARIEGFVITLIKVIYVMNVK